MNCIIVEDQAPAQRILKKYIADIGTLHIKGTFATALEALEFLKRETVHVIFLDIHLPKISGIEFLKTLVNPPHIILTTAFPDYALESYDLNVVDYLLKPFSFQRFVKAVAKIPNPELSDRQAGQGQHDYSRSKDLFVKSGHEHIKIRLDDIIYIQSDADYTEIHFKDKRILSTDSLRQWNQILNDQQFARVHKSYIINTFMIEKVVSNLIYLSGGTKVPIGRAYKEYFVERFMR